MQDIKQVLHEFCLSADLSAHKMQVLPHTYFPDQSMQKHGCFSGLTALMLTFCRAVLGPFCPWLIRPDGPASST